MSGDTVPMQVALNVFQSDCGLFRVQIKIEAVDIDVNVGSESLKHAVKEACVIVSIQLNRRGYGVTPQGVVEALEAALAQEMGQKVLN
jgi:hypothetical protein